MVRSDPYSMLSLEMLPLSGSFCMLDNDFLLIDDLDLDTAAPSVDLRSDPVAEFIAPLVPFKLRFSLILFCTGGSMRMQLNMDEFELRRNDILIAHSGSIGQCLEISPDCRVAVIAFANSFYNGESNSEGMVVVRSFLARRSLLRVGPEEMEELIGIYRLMYRKIEQPDFRCKHEVVAGCMQVLFGDLCQWMAPFVAREEQTVGSRKQQLFDSFMRLLSEHYGSERSIGFYAERLCVTPKYLSQVVRAVSGRHAGAWIRDYVILEAKALLRSRRYTVQQVSDRLNFPNQSFFGVYFKKAVGCSPKAYRDGGEVPGR